MGIAGMFVWSAIVMGIILPSLGDRATTWATLLTYGVGAVVGVVSYFVTWKRGEAKERARQGRCLKCGYDLTGNISGVCPECGTAVEQPEPKP